VPASQDGIDAGGVKKEFFQLLVTELLCPDYGMLMYQPVGRTDRRTDGNTHGLDTHVSFPTGVSASD
jgi:hypothetical protein